MGCHLAILEGATQHSAGERALITLHRLPQLSICQRNSKHLEIREGEFRYTNQSKEKIKA